MGGEAKFTPGPWEARWSKYREDEFIVHAGMPSMRVLARFDGDGHGLGPDGQSIADAHLIAAAPDLLEALQAVIALPDAQAFLRNLDKGIGTKTESAAWLHARSAIAKATGGAS